MKKINLFMLGALLFSTFSMASCEKNDNSSSATSSNKITDSNSSSSSLDDSFKTYSIEIESIGGKKLSGVAVEIYLNNELVKSLFTDSTGCVEASLENNNYSVELRNLPAGYYYEKSYELVKDIFEYHFEVLSFVPSEEAPSGTEYELGDVMYDFTVTDSDGVEFNLQTYLNDYSAVVINFWYTTCYWCLEEFPYMEEAYQTYKDDIAIIALSISDENPVISGFKLDFGLSFNMAFDSEGIYSMFSFNGTPSTVIIDRYGVIAFIEEGAITATETFNEIFDQFIGDDYYPITNVEEDEVDKTIPNVSMPSSEEIEKVINADGFNATYHIDEDEPNLAFTWPWIISEDGNSIQPANSKIDSTAATIETSVTIPEGKVLAFDYFASTEKDYDILYVVIDGVAIHTISGVEKEWKTCYAYVSEETKIYNVSLCYSKDYESFEGEDTVYINNMRFVDIEDIDTPTYIYRYCSKGILDETTLNYSNYIDTYYSEEDGYYHVGSETGPLVLADLIYATKWSKDYSLMSLASNGYCEVDGTNYGPTITQYASYAGNGTNGYTPVTQELYEAMSKVTNYISNNENENEWLEACGYFNAYGTNGVELEDPIKGLATFNAFEAKVGNQNFATYTKPIIPRGYKFKFVVEESGVYKINSIGTKEAISWILDENGEIIYESSVGARHFRLDESSMLNFEMYFYFEAGKTYFINPAYGDIYEVGTLQFNIEYVAPTYELLTICAPGYFTTTIDEEGNMTDEIISGGIDIYYDATDGYYHELREDGTVGSIIYADFEYPNFIFNYTLLDMIKLNGFVFTYDDETTEDLTRTAQAIAATRITEEGDLYGCVPVTKEVASLLQALMDYYTFPDVENSWAKLCYYYQYFGPSTL